MKIPLPQSLFARLLAGLIAAIGIALIAVVLMIVHERRQISFWSSGAWRAADNIALASRELSALDERARSERIEDYRAQRRLVERPRPSASPREREEIARIQRAFADKIRAQLGPHYSVTMAPARGRPRHAIPVSGTWPADARAPQDTPPRNVRLRDRWFDVAIRLPDGDVVLFRTLVPLPGPPLPKQIFINIGVLTLVLAGVLYFMTRSITRPLSDLARAADAIGRGEPHRPLPETGARELRDATRAFNTMQERLHRYLDSRTRVLAAMSHDLRTPLTRLRLRAEALPDDATQARFVADIDEMSRMVAGTLNMFKGLNNEEPMRQVIVDDLLSALQAEFSELGRSFAIEGHSDAPILAKEQQLKRCLSNLLDNALKYAGNAAVRLRDGDELVITITDTGPGVPPTEIEKVFEPFYRVEASRSRDTGGTGLGLSIARDIVQAHGGSITLHNLEAGGLEATVCLPRERER
jgi:signal transduction histidine kinase